MHERARASAPPVRQFLNAEADRLGVYERKAIAIADLSLLISRRDLAYLGDPARARVLPNGIDPPDPQLVAPEREARTLVFSGRMSYFPNSDAAIWFANEVFPLIRAVEPSCAFRIVGREPTAAVRRLGSRPGITVTGPVQLMEAELSRASISVCPMRFGSGMQTKILEAMATGTPVIGTTKALEGIPDDLSKLLPRADSPTDFASEVVRILRDPAPAMKRASEGLAAIRSRHLWRHSVAELERLHEETIAGFRSSSRRRQEIRSA
jgi:polysaccharide biosynthesis protein PslH